MVYIPCTCGGNENCRRCDGSGLRDIRTPPEPLASCPECGVRVRRADLVLHRASTHGVASAAARAAASHPPPGPPRPLTAGSPPAALPPPGLITLAVPQPSAAGARPRGPVAKKATRKRTAAAKRPPPGFVLCPACPATVKAENLQGHLSRVHPDVALRGSRPRKPPDEPTPAPTSAKPSRPLPASKPLVTCPECRCELRASNLERHLKRVHPETYPRSSQGPSRTVVTGVTPPAVRPETPGLRVRIARVRQQLGWQSVACPYCQTHTCRRDELAQHVYDRHSKQEAALFGRVGQKPFRYNAPSTTIPNRPSPDGLDGSAGTHMFRERGRFGSGSSHDDSSEGARA